MPRLLLFVAVGGVLGALARAALIALASASAVSDAAAVLGINVVGSAVAGFLAARVADRLSDRMRSFTFAGVLGGFTTFSAVSVEAVAAFGSDGTAPGAAVIALGVGVIIPVIAAWVGLRLGRVAR